MPRIPDEFIDCIVYLYPDLASADSGAPLGGTGFIVRTLGQTDPSIEFFHIVTNKHVIENGNTIVRFNLQDAGHDQDSGHDSFDYPKSQWEKSPNADVAVCLLPNLDRSRLNVAFISPSLFLTTQEIAGRDIGMGSEVFFIGRFINAEGKDKNRPSLRFGTLAQTDTQIIDGGETFLVEARSIPGFSGSPVFAYPPRSGVPRPVLSMGSPGQMGPWLLGIDCGHIYDYLAAVDDRGQALPFKVRSNSGMMTVVPVWWLDKLINGEKMKRARAAREREIISRRVSSVT
jgi:hypothetical protein